jgi:hypothetical protein
VGFHEILWDFMRFHEVLWDSMRFHGILWSFMRFYDVSVNQSVPAEASRGLTSYRGSISWKGLELRCQSCEVGVEKYMYINQRVTRRGGAFRSPS